MTKDNNWTDSFKNLDEYKGDKKINYTIKEVKVENGYTSVTTGSAENGFKVTNTREPEKTKVEGEKTWDDANDQDGKRPNEITVNLLANGKKVKEAKVTKDTNWKYSFTDLDKYKDGQEITYTVTENEVKDYTTKIEGYKITNRYTP